MRILYIGQLWEGSTTVERMRVLEQWGFDILPFDTTPFASAGTRIERSLAHRANIGRGISHLNAKLMVLTKEARFDAVWIDKGVWIYPETVTILRARSERRIAVHYTPDPARRGQPVRPQVLCARAEPISCSCRRPVPHTDKVD